MSDLEGIEEQLKRIADALDRAYPGPDQTASDNAEVRALLEKWPDVIEQHP